VTARRCSWLPSVRKRLKRRGLLRPVADRVPSAVSWSGSDRLFWCVILRDGKQLRYDTEVISLWFVIENQSIHQTHSGISGTCDLSELAMPTGLIKGRCCRDQREALRS